ncbi:MAG: hypothetical protein C0628_07045 [Sulfurimonas sp.]|nr:MAG: hypothetical protein C0628_07045 [Sulfurimonas sp.]
MVHFCTAYWCTFGLHLTIKAKLREIENFFVATITDLETLLNDSKKKEFIGIEVIDYLKKPKEEIEAELYKKKQEYEYFQKKLKNNIHGWDYFEDVCYLSDEEQKNLKKNVYEWTTDYDLTGYPKEKIFKHINKLIYYRNDIKKLERTQENVRKNKIAEPIKEILTILRYIGNDDEAAEPLIKLLARMKGNHSDKLSAKQRELYISYYTKEAKIKKPSLNIDRLKRLKEDYENEICKLKTTIKNHQENNFNDVTSSILEKLNLPTRKLTRKSR